MNYTDTDRKNDFHWFLENYNSLYKQYRHKFIAIQNKTILGIYDDKLEALDKTSKNYPLGTFCVQECTGDESGYTEYVSSAWKVG